MKKSLLLLILMIALFVSGYAQDQTKINQIDSLVKIINAGKYKVATDSIIKDMPEMELYMKTYITVEQDGDQLKKYINHVRTRRKVKGDFTTITTIQRFYFNEDKLIKVEESGFETPKDEYKMDWYYEDDKPLYYTLKKDRADEHADLLLTIAKTIVTSLKPKQ